MKRIVLPVVGRNEPYELAPGKIVCLGLNYREHIAESVSVQVRGFDHTQPSEPVLFPKLPTSLLAPGESIVLPAIAASYDFPEPRTDYEGELAVIIGVECKNVRVDEVPGVIFGYTCANDVSQRNIQNGDRSGWFRGKSFDTFAPVGPVIVPRDMIADVQALRITTTLNGSVVQDSSTNRMIFSVNEMISFISRNFTLEPGDLILTGTPAGVGPLSHGDTVSVTIESIGTLTNPVIDEAVIDRQ